MRPISQEHQERATYERIKSEMLKTVEAIRAKNPEAADYLAQHLIFDDQAMTFSHTVDPAIFRFEWVSATTATNEAAGEGNH